MTKLTWLDRAIAYVSPERGIARARARRAHSNFYEGGEPPSRTRTGRASNGDANVSTQRGAVRIRDKARSLDENYDVAIGVLDVLVNKTIGTGVRPEPQIMLRDGTPAKEVNDTLIALFRDWVKIPEVTWQLGYFQLQRTMARTFFRDGEVLGQLIAGLIPSLDHGTTVPFSIEALEPDFCPYDLNDGDRNIAQGIGLNAWGRPRAYYVFKQHPGAGGFTSLVTTVDQVKVIPSESMLHAKLTHRLHQLRGVSIFRGVLDRFNDIKEIDETERVAARVAAAMAGYIKKGDAQTYNPDNNPVGEPRTFEMAPGMVFDTLLPGEEIGTIASNRPNNALIQFRLDQLRSLASGTSTNASSISNSYDGTYSAQRQELVESKGAYDALTDYLIDVLFQPIWEHFVDAAVAARLVKFSNDVDRKTIYDASHSRPAMPWIDPMKEVNAQAEAEDRGYMSRSEIVRARGRQPDEVLREIRRDQDEAKALGVKTSRLAAPANNSGGAQPAQTDTTNEDSNDGKAQPPQ